MPWYIRPHSLVPWEWLYRAMIYPPPLSSSRGEGVIMSWHFIFIPHNICWEGVYIVTYFHSPQYLVGDDYIMTLHFHSWQHLVRGWLHRSIIFSVPTIFGEGVTISWCYIFTPGNIWWGCDYIVTLYFHSRQYMVRGWLYRDIIFSLMTIFGEGVIISWHYIFTPDNIWWGGDYIVTLYFHSWQYLVRGHYISWHYILTPDNIWWGDDYIVTLYFHSWHAPGIWHWRWLYLNIFTIQIWDSAVIQGFYYHIHIFTPWNLGAEMIIFKHDTLFAVETYSVSGGYVNRLYQQCMMN